MKKQNSNTPSVLVVASVLASVLGPTNAAGMTFTVDPILSSWLRNTTDYARVRRQEGETPATRWPSTPLDNQLMDPALSDVQGVYYTDRFVYVTMTGLASHVMGPWVAFDEVGNEIPFPQFPLDLGATASIPRPPFLFLIGWTRATPAGPIGVWVNGTAVYNMMNRQDPVYPLWHTDAYYDESETFDPAGFHQDGEVNGVVPPTLGQYHAHSNPKALRWVLGDNVSAFQPRSASDPLGYYERIGSRFLPGPTHSPILGWAFDGLPIYGPYGYSIATDSSSSIQRMLSGYTLRNGDHGTWDLRKTDRTALPVWAARVQGLDSVYLDDSDEGPSTDEAPLGTYIEDYAYRGDVIGGGTEGEDWDLDRYNHRWCVTPEYPEGTHAYFVTIDGDGTPVFPYVIGPEYYGFASGGMGWNGDAPDIPAPPEIPADADEYTGASPLSLDAPTTGVPAR